MTMAEIEGRLPAGFHDATLLNVAIDYEKLEARIEFKLWLPNEAERETYARATLLLENIQYLIIARWCNGSTADSESVCHGSNPCRAAIQIFKTHH